MILPFYLLLVDLVVGRSNATRGCDLPTFRGRYLAAKVLLLCQNPADLMSSSDIFAKNAKEISSCTELGVNAGPLGSNLTR